MAETQLWEWLKPLCPQGHYTRVENGEAGPGTPDVYYRLPMTSGWIELKDARHPKSKIPFPNEKVGLHLSQRIWIREEVTLGGLVWIVARVGKEILWISGTYHDKFNGASIQSLRRMSRLTFSMTDNQIPVRKIYLQLNGSS